jgi:hypothetical protein
MIIHFTNLYNYLERDYIAQQCLKSWQKNMSEHQIKIWTENDEYIKKVLNRKSKFLDYLNKNNGKKSFYCDYIRLNLLYDFGGMYVELDQFLPKHLEIDENINLSFGRYENTITTEFLPCYFKKGNILIKFLIDYLDNDFNIDIMRINNRDGNWGYCELTFFYLRNPPEEVQKEYKEILKNSKIFFEKNGYFAYHLYDWWIYDGLTTLIIKDNEEQFKNFCESFISENENNPNKIKLAVFHFSYNNKNLFQSLNNNCLFCQEINNKDYGELLLKTFRYNFLKSGNKKIIDPCNLIGDLNDYKFEV